MYTSAHSNLCAAFCLERLSSISFALRSCWFVNALQWWTIDSIRFDSIPRDDDSFRLVSFRQTFGARTDRSLLERI